MTMFMRIAVAAIAVIAVVGGTVYLTESRQGFGGTPPTPSPTVTTAPSSAPQAAEALATVPIDWTSYTSSRFGYTADYPADWRVTQATADWPTIGLPDKGGASMDIFGPSPFGTAVWVSSVPLKPGKDAAHWIALLDSQNAAFCNQTSNRHSITLDGVNVRQEDQVCAQTIHIIEVLGASDSRFFEIIIVRDLSDGSPLTDTERATFDRFLATFRFGG